MRKVFRALLAVAATTLAPFAVRAVENTWDNAVRASSSVQASPARITLTWPQDTNGTPSSYTVYRKAPGASSWGSGTSLSGSSTSYVDTNVTPGTAYEYRIVKAAGGYTGYGYIQTGINVPLVESRGKVVLLVDNTHATALATELTRLQQDLVGDGWTVLRHDVSRTASVTSIKNLIKSDYEADPANVKSVFLFGRIPVPYSGDLYPDGHSDHRGAWPADAFYGDMDGNWTDSSTSFTQSENTNPAERTRLTNRPGDGKFDQSTLPSAVELQIGRVDLSNMPGSDWTGGPANFPSEVELLRQYLNKDHKFRHRITNPQRRAIVGDYFGWRNGEAFSSSAYGAFAAFFGADNTRNLNVVHNDTRGVWVPELAANDYLWAFGAGAGSYTTIAGLGNGANYNNATTPEIVENNLKATFNLVFGSWLGDWDSQDNFMRGILATRDYGLTAAWSGRPHWFTHPMGLGETIGYTARLTQNNTGLYQNQIDSSANRIHVALMGDPTLRMHPVAPVRSLNGSRNGATASLSWQASTDSVLGYHVYRASSALGAYTRLTSSLVTGTSFTDNNSVSGSHYMVRAVKLESTPSGSYQNASQGLFWSSGTDTTPVPPDTTAPSVSLSAPIGGTTVVGPVTISAEASDAVGVSGVQFQLNGVNLGSEDTSAPYSLSWNTAEAANGSASLTAIARDAAGNRRTSSVVTVNVANVTPTPPDDTTPPPVDDTPSPPSAPGAWFDDALPETASGYGSEAWNWITANPAPFSGTKAHQSALAAGLHEHAFAWASDTLTVATGDILYAYVYLDPANPPTAIMLGWNVDGDWDHRAYWGANRFTYGVDGTPGRRSLGALPATGRWVRLEIPAASVGLEGKTVSGMSFSAFDGRVTWDQTGISDDDQTDEPVEPTPPPDTSSPTVSLTAPRADAVVSGQTVSFSANATDTSGIAYVRFLVDGNVVGTKITAAPYTFEWDSTTVSNGTHTISARAYDHAGNRMTTSESTFTVDNVRPSVSVTAPKANATVSGSAVSLTASASDNVRIASVQFQLDGVNIGPKLLTSPYTLKWDSRAATNGARRITAIATDSAGNKKSASVTVTIKNPVDTTSPFVSLTAPARNATVSGSVSLKANATDNVDIASVRFYVNGQKIGSTDTVAPYSRTWDTTSVDNGTHTITAVAYDLAGNKRTSSAVTVTVRNATTPPTVTVEAIDPVATIAGDDHAVLAFNRTGSTAAALTVDFTLGGTAVKWNDYYRIPEGDMPVSVTIPAGASSKTITIAAKANSTNAAPATATFTLAETPSYDVGTPDPVTVTLAPAPSTPTPPDDPVTPPPTTTPVEPPPSEPSDPTEPDEPTEPEPIEVGENAALALPAVGDHTLRVLSPTILELERITTKAPDPATVTDWNFVSTSGVLTAPAASKFAVTVDGVPVSVKSVGFKRRVRYAPLDTRDLRIGNSLYLELHAPIADNKTVVVRNPDASLWPITFGFVAETDPLRNSPAIHVNQEGYVPSFAKQAIIGHYLGNLGELPVTAGAEFKLINTLNGAIVHTGTLVPRADVGYRYSPMPYQQVLMADFSSFRTPGEYQLVVPGLGSSLPFLIDEGIAMGFARTYALGLYHQRSGHDNVMPYTRHTRGAGHTAPAEIPSTLAGYEFTWTTIASKNADTGTTNPPGVGRQLNTPAAQLYPFVNTGRVDVSGGHFDAGDYSKYTINSAQLAHTLLFTADSIAGAAALDNLGLPESSDGISDILQMAKLETDYISKLQDADGGFYFIVYPKTRAYESDVLPDRGDTQVVWPKNTSATAASVAALAQAASSPRFKAAYPDAASAYLQKARLGWQFLMNAVATHGRLGSYQKITFYGDNYIHNDEIAWAAASLYAATGETQYHTALKDWFPDPSSPDTMRWSWWRMSEGYGNAIRVYAFATRSGRLAADKLDPAYLAKCEEQVLLAGNDALTWSRNNAYGSAFPTETKHVMSAGWYFSLDQASDMAVAYQLDPRQDYLDALVGNMNYEAGSNPVNVSYLTGLGLKRQREIVNQYAKNDRRVLPPAGIPIGNIISSFGYLSNYGASGNELSKLSFPSDDGSSNVYAFYDRWTDVWNVGTEFITVNQARGLMAVTALTARTTSRIVPWKSATARIVVPTAVVPLDAPVTLTLDTTGLNLAGARILWEGRDQQPDYGATYAFTPRSTGEQWAEAEIVWPDGRRVVAAATFTANSPTVVWVDDAIPAGAWVNGNESWNWISGNPAVQSGAKAHQSTLTPGLTEHAFNDAASPLVIDTGDKLFVWVYIDPANIPSELMLHWNDGTWEHRAYWGGNNIHYGTDGTASRHRVGDIPAAGEWVKLEVPARAVGLEGRAIKGMCFSVYGGRVTWDTAGKTSEEQPTP